MRSSYPFNDFLETASGKEVALAIAKDDKELKEFSEWMNEKGFKEAGKVIDILSSPKSYILVTEDAGKDIYDFASQYSTGQVEVFDKESMKSKTASPDYGNSTLVLLVEKSELTKLQSKGFDLVSLAGPAFQS